MAQAKTFYTYAELAKRNTEALIRVYNRIFNTNAWEVWFTPYEHRTDMLVELMADMRMQKAHAMTADFVKPTEPIKAIKIVVSEEGIAILWNEGPKFTGKRKVTDEQMEMIRALREDGETMQGIANVLGLTKITVFRVLQGDYSLTENRWNTKTVEGKTVRKSAPSVQVFTAKRNPDARVYLPVLDMERPNAAFWTEMGL